MTIIDRAHAYKYKYQKDIAQYPIKYNKSVTGQDTWISWVSVCSSLTHR